MLGGRIMYRRTYSGSGWVGGEFSKGTSTDSTFTGAFRPANMRTISVLPEGDRARDPRALFTKVELTPESQHDETPSDLVSPDGVVWYEIQGDANNSSAFAMRSPINHFKYLCLRLKEVEP